MDVSRSRGVQYPTGTDADFWYFEVSNESGDG